MMLFAIQKKNRLVLAGILFSSSLGAQSGVAPVTGDVFEAFRVARIAGSGTDTTRGVTADAEGNIYFVGSTTSPDLPMRNAIQRGIGGSQFMRSTDLGATWTPLANLPSGNPLAIGAHPTLAEMLFAVADNGLFFKSTDSGASWRKVHDTGWIGIDTIPIAFDPANPDRLYTGGQRGLFASEDGGETWAKRRDTPAFELSTDPNGSGALLARLFREVSLTQDAGRTWTVVRGPWGDQAPTALALVPHRPGWIYAAVRNESVTHVSLSQDWGRTWTRMSVQGISYLSNLVVDPDAANRLYAPTQRGLYRSADGGRTFQPPPDDATVGAGCNVCVPVSLQLAILRRTCGGGAFFSGLGSYPDRVAVGISADAGQTWRAGPFVRVRDIATGAGCTVYAARTLAQDAFIAKLDPKGEMLWSTYFGGTNEEVASAVAVDANGNVLVAGYTESDDLAVSSAVGPNDRRRLLVASFNSSGGINYTTTVGGTFLRDIPYVSGFAVDREGSAYVTGSTLGGASLPVTPGVYQSSPGAGYVVKLSPAGSLVYATYIGTWSSPFSIGVDRDGQAVIVGNYYIARLDPAGSKLTYLDLTSQSVLALRGVLDAEGNLYLVGHMGNANHMVTGFSSPIITSGGPSISKLRASDFQPVYTVQLGGDWRGVSYPLALAPLSDGSLSVAWLVTTDGFPLRRPLAQVGLCPANQGYGVAIGVLDPSGASLRFGSYTDSCAAHTIPGALAATADGDLLVGSNSMADTAVLKLPMAPVSAVVVHGVGNAFSGTHLGAVPGMLVAVEGENLGPDAPIDLGLNSPAPLPRELGGTRVYFDGEPAPIMLSSAGRVICLAPAGIQDRSVVQVSHSGVLSNPVEVKVWPSDLQVLMRDFPETRSAIANVRNADGTLNSESNPAAPGSTVTVFLTGVATTATGAPAPVFDSWHSNVIATYPEPVPGFVPGLFKVQLTTPRTGTRALPLALLARRGTSTFPLRFWEYSRTVMVYVDYPPAP